MDETEKENLSIQGQDYCNKATQFNHKGIYSQAIELFNKAESCFMQIKDQQWLVFLRHEKLQSLRGLHKNEEALKLCDEVSSGYLLLKDYKGLSLVLTHKAHILMDVEQFHAALNCLRIAESLAKEKKLFATLGYIYSIISSNYWELQNFIAAIENIEKALKYYSIEENPLECAWCYHYQGLCHKAIYSFELAKKWLEKSYQTYLNANDFQSAIAPMENLRTLLISSGQKDQAERLNEMIMKTGKLHTRNTTH